MDKLITLIERGKPFFNAIARNKYLKAIRDGFISIMPIIIVSSIFLLVAAVPNVWGFYWPTEVNDVLMKAYNYSMGSSPSAPRRPQPSTSATPRTATCPRATRSTSSPS